MSTQREIIDASYWSPRELSIDGHEATARNIAYGTTAVVCQCGATAVSSNDEKATAIIRRKHRKAAES